MRSLYALFAAIALLFFAGTAEAATSTTGRAVSLSVPTVGAAAVAGMENGQLFAAAPVADEALATAYGTSLSRGIVRTANASYAAGDFQQVGSVNRIAMDNWFHDVGDPIVASNLARPIGFT